MFTLLKVTKTQANKGIYHTRSNGDFVQELFRKDADLVYEVTDKCSYYYGKSYAFFIIEAESTDKLKYDGQEHYIHSYRDFDQTTAHIAYLKSCEVKEMYYELIKQDKPLPQKFNNLLKECLPPIFECVVVRKNQGFDSSCIFRNYECILDNLQKNFNEYVKQQKIDEFIHELIIRHELKQIESFKESQCIHFNSKNLNDYEHAIEEVESTIQIVRDLISQKSCEDIYHTIDGDPMVSIYAKDTPCGDIEVYIFLESEEFFVKLCMNNNTPWKEETTMDISKHCADFKDNF